MATVSSGAATTAGQGVDWSAELGGWLVRSHRLASVVLRDDESFTVDDPRFSTRRLTGPSMLTVDGAEHARHRAAFGAAFRAGAVRYAMSESLHASAVRLVAERAAVDVLEVRSELAQPLAVQALREILSLTEIPVAELTDWYLELTEAFDTDSGAGEAEVVQRMRVRCVGLPRPDGLTIEEYVGNLAIMLLGGIETMEGMIAHAVEHRYGLGVDPDGGFLDESLRLKTPVLRLDRYASRDCELGGQRIGAGDLVVLAVDQANLDPVAFPDPARFDPERSNRGRHLSFAVGPHYCLGVHLARLETAAALAAIDEVFPRARIDPERSEPSTGSIFRKPDRLTLVRG